MVSTVNIGYAARRVFLPACMAVWVVVWVAYLEALYTAHMVQHLCSK